jgi:ring-1,2-phenylacetyl-CoA epoxidase subunit PaaC
MSHDSAYEGLLDANDPRWAFGSDFSDPLAGVDTTVPDGVDPADLAGYCLMLGDDALIASHRLQEWLTHGPELEDEVALGNIALDLLGQARLLLARAGTADGTDRDEDAFAYLRDASEFRNLRFVEAPNGDFARAMMRLLLFSTSRLALLQRLIGSRDPVLSAIAEKGVKEVAYHRDYAARWVVRLGDGTALSHQRMQDAVDAILPEAEELLVAHDVELRLAEAGVGVDPSQLRGELEAVVAQVLQAGTLTRPAATTQPISGGRDGVHGEALDGVLDELQSFARSLPGATW